MRGWVKQTIDKYLDLKSFKTERQLLVIESDDWGSLRTRDKITRDKLSQVNISASKDIYIQYDSIATASDLLALFEILNAVKDKTESPACITANVCTANPDFDKIKESNFQHFYYKPFTKTLEEYSENTEQLFKIWKEGITDKVFIPQLHGREHVHAIAWLNELRAGNKDLLNAFDLEAWGIPYYALVKQKRHNLQAALDVYNLADEKKYHQDWVRDSAQIFENSFGYKSKSFIPPAYTWHDDINSILALSQIKTIQGIKLQYKPKYNKPAYKKKPHYTGEINRKHQLIYTTRNAFFEPDTAPHKDWVDIALSGIKHAFDKKQPAILGSHRINFIGRLDIKHRDKNLKMFKQLLHQLVRQYPDIEFIDSGTLADILKH